ncbi:MAG: hypothetical protein K2P78_12310, partial [Gemmataceae bacterium]|nr:hypothetical protein [Gemmataceae bacterium]
MMWYRVFGLSDVEVPPAAVAAHLHAAGLPVEPHFRGDDLGWTAGELRLPGKGTPVILNRYLAAADDLRDDLNVFAAVLETQDYSPNHGRLMGHVIRTRQLIAMRKPLDAADEVTLEKVLDATCRFLAAGTDGLIYVDGRGWFTPAGE